MQIFLKLTFLCIIFTYHVFTQSACIEKIGSDMINCVADDENYLWCGTKEKGLLRVTKSDGSTTYWNAEDSEIGYNQIKSVLIRNEKVYVSTDSTILTFDGIQFTKFDFDVGAHLIIDNDDNLLLVGNKDFYKLDKDDKVIYYQDLDEVVGDMCCSRSSDVTIDNNNNVWLSHYDFYEFDILKYDGNEWIIYDHINSILPIESFTRNYITSIGNNIYATNYNGVYLFESDKWSILYSSDNQIIANDNDDMKGYYTLPIEAINNSLWVGGNDIATQEEVKLAFMNNNNNNWKFINTIANLSAINTIEKSSTDKDIVYVGTDDGILKINTECLENTTSTGYKNNMDISIFPNPSNDLIYIESQYTIDKLEIYNIDGEIILEEYMPENSIDIAQFKNGAYIIKLISRDNVSTYKFIKN